GLGGIQKHLGERTVAEEPEPCGVDETTVLEIDQRMRAPIWQPLAKWFKHHGAVLLEQRLKPVWMADRFGRHGWRGRRAAALERGRTLSTGSRWLAASARTPRAHIPGRDTGLRCAPVLRSRRGMPDRCCRPPSQPRSCGP